MTWFPHDMMLFFFLAYCFASLELMETWAPGGGKY